MSVKVRYSDELYHHGIKGQKWGVRRFQNPDGSLTPAGRERYGVEKVSHVISNTNLNDPESKRYIQKIMSERAPVDIKNVNSIIAQGGKIHATVSRDELNNFLSKRRPSGFDVGYLGRWGSGKNSVYLTSIVPKKGEWISRENFTSYLDNYYDKDKADRVRQKHKNAARLKAIATTAALLGGAAAVTSGIVAKQKFKKDF